jgi:hypothetical protein
MSKSSRLSNDLLEYIQNEGFAKNIHPQTLSRYSKKFLERLLKQISDAYLSWDPNAVSMRFTNIPKNESRFPKGSDYNFSPKEIRDEIENLDKVCCIAVFEINGRAFKVNIVAPIKTYTKEYFTQCIQRIYIWLSVCSLHAREKCSKKMSIYLYFTDLKKTLPDHSGAYLTEINVNTAFTTSCKEVTELHLFRHEEWFKVLIHETFHNMGLDFSEFNQENTKRAILDIFPVNSEVRLFETYCEMWAEVLNILFIVSINNKKNGDVENLEAVENMILKEQLFSMFQCAKVLYYFGMDYEDLYKKDDVRSLRRYKEKTQVLSYYILKSLLFFHCDDFITWCIKNNNNETLDFNKNQATVESYCQLVKAQHNNYDFVRGIDFMIKKFSTMSEDELKSPISRTLRMTIHDI